MSVEDFDSKYKQHIYAIYQEKLSEDYSTDDEEIRFTREDIDFVEEEYELDNIRNKPDMVSSFRPNNNPKPLKEDGYPACVRAYEREAVYYITQRDQVLELPSIDSREFLDGSDIPDLVQSYVYGNEQSLLTQVRYTGLIPEYVGFDECYHCQDHLQTQSQGQAEIDGLYVGREDNEDYAILIEGKNNDEHFIRNQLYINKRTIEDKDEFPDNVIVLGLSVRDEGSFSLVEFDIPDSRGDGMVEISNIQNYRFNQTDIEGFQE